MSADLIASVDRADEVRISSYRADGSLRPWVIIWAVVVDGGIYARSANGAEGRWYGRALASDRGRIRVGSDEWDVTFEHPVDEAVEPAIDAEYSRKYARYASIVRGIVGPSWYDITLRLVPSA